mmetsp:Transcript_18520/g.50231  ORF Transcript_18520/g.50231 Transcript_18520/m.50231 type:complete len:603 (-) Transcript_18520:74-1882(-)
MRGSLVTNAPSTAKKTSGTVCGPTAAGTLKSKPATSASTASCIAPSASSDRTGPALSPCTTPPLLPTPVVRPALVSMRLIAASCSAITTADTAGRTPAHRSTASCVVLQMDSKNRRNRRIRGRRSSAPHAPAPSPAPAPPSPPARCGPPGSPPRTAVRAAPPPGHTHWFQREHEELEPVRLQPHVALPPEERRILARLWQQHAHILRPRRRCRRAHRLAPRRPLLLRVSRQLRRRLQIVRRLAHRLQVAPPHLRRRTPQVENHEPVYPDALDLAHALERRVGAPLLHHVYRVATCEPLLRRRRLCRLCSVTVVIRLPQQVYERRERPHAAAPRRVRPVGEQLHVLQHLHLVGDQLAVARVVPPHLPDAAAAAPWLRRFAHQFRGDARLADDLERPPDRGAALLLLQRLQTLDQPARDAVAVWRVHRRRVLVVEFRQPLCAVPRLCRPSSSTRLHAAVEDGFQRRISLRLFAILARDPRRVVSRVAVAPQPCTPQPSRPVALQPFRPRQALLRSTVVRRHSPSAPRSLSAPPSAASTSCSSSPSCSSCSTIPVRVSWMASIALASCSLPTRERGCHGRPRSLLQLCELLHRERRELRDVLFEA